MATQRLAVFFPTFGGGGAEKAMLLFAEGAAAQGYTVDVVVCDNRGPLAQTVSPGLEVVNLGCGRVRRAFLPLLRYIRKSRPQVVYSTLPHANLVAIAACRLAGTKVVVRQATSHLSDVKKGTVDRLASRLIPWCYSLADGVIAVSRGVKGQLNSINHNLSVSVLPNPILTPYFDQLVKQPLRHAWFRRGQPPVILAVGRLTRYKGLHTLLHAFARVRRGSRARLVILGEGPERENLLQQARELGIEDDVSLPGFVLNPLPFMRRAKVFVLASEYEGMPNVLLQAMACGTAVVSTDCESGPREVLNNGRLGRLVPVGNECEMAKAIQCALSQLETIPQAARYVRDNFSVERTVREYLTLGGLGSGGGGAVPT